MLIWEVFIQHQHNRKNVVVTTGWENWFNSPQCSLIVNLLNIPQVDFYLFSDKQGILASISICDKGKS